MLKMPKFSNLSHPHKKRILLAFFTILVPVLSYIVFCSATLYDFKYVDTLKFEDPQIVTDEEWDYIFDTNEDKGPDDYADLVVTVGTYIESISDVSIHDSQFNAQFLLWFRWNDNDWTPAQYPGENFRVGNGTIRNRTLVEEYHQDGIHYQQYRVSATMEKYFSTERFPLESHQLKIYIEDNRDVSYIIYTPDEQYTAVSPYVEIPGYKIMNTSCGLYANEYVNTLNNPELSAFNQKITVEYVANVRINRSGPGLYLKAFLNLTAILLWVFIAMFNCAYRGNDPMGAINTGIFGSVSSMLVGINLLSDAPNFGLLGMVNLYGLGIILFLTVFVMRLITYRNKNEDPDFISCYGRMLFWTTSSLSLLANILLPLTAYLWI